MEVHHKVMLGMERTERRKSGTVWSEFSDVCYGDGLIQISSPVMHQQHLLFSQLPFLTWVKTRSSYLLQTQRERIMLAASPILGDSELEASYYKPGRDVLASAVFTAFIV